MINFFLHFVFIFEMGRTNLIERKNKIKIKYSKGLLKKGRRDFFFYQPEDIVIIYGFFSLLIIFRRYVFENFILFLLTIDFRYSSFISPTFRLSRTQQARKVQCGALYQDKLSID